MRSFNFVRESKIKETTRVKQLSAMFDCPVSKKASVSFAGALPEANDGGDDWNIGLIVGPSGCGKSSILSEIYGEQQPLTWWAASVVDDFDPDLSMEAISGVCQAVGFSTIPAWMRPYKVLSNGEKFRVEMARRLLQPTATGEPIVVDEFTSVVDRRVAQICSFAIQKYVRRQKLQFVAASCHYDILDWLQPDWVFEPASGELARGRLWQRPELEVEIRRVNYSAWRLFAPFHYLTAELNRGAKCYGLFIDGQLASFAGMMRMPHPTAKDIMRCSRLVTLPDFQGLGLAMILVDALGAAYKAIGERMRTYPAHPGLIRSFDKSPRWKMTKAPGKFSAISGNRLAVLAGKVPKYKSLSGENAFGGRPCATFEYVGGRSVNKDEARRLLGK